MKSVTNFNKLCSVFPDVFTIRYANPDHSKSMLAAFGPEPETILVLTSKGLFQKLSIDGDSTLSVYKEDVLHR